MARTFTADVVLGLVDRLSGALGRTGKNVDRELSNIQRSFRRLDHSGFSAVAGFTGLTAVSTQLHRMAESMREISRLQNQLAAASVRINAEGGLDVLGAKGRAEDLASAMEVSKRYNTTVQKALEEQEQLAKAGLTPQQARAASGPLLELSRVAQVPDTAEFTRNAIGVMADFKMPMGTAEEIEKSSKAFGNMMAYASTRKVKIDELMESFRFAGPLMAATGMSFKTATAALIELAQANIRGSEAGVSLRWVMSSLLSPTNKAAKEFHDFGVDFKKFSTDVPISGERIGQALQGQFPSFNPAGHSGELRNIALMTGMAERLKATADFARQYIPEVAEETATVFQEQMNVALISATKKIDLPGLMREMFERGMGPDSIVKIFGARQAPRVLALMQRLQSVFQTEKIGVPDDFMDKQFDELTKGFDGAMQHLEGAFSRFAGIFANSWPGEAMVTSINAIATAVDALATAFEHLSGSEQGAITGLAAAALAVGAWKSVGGFLRILTKGAGGALLAGEGTAAAATGGGMIAAMTSFFRAASAGAGGFLLGSILGGDHPVGDKFHEGLAKALDTQRSKLFDKGEEQRHPSTYDPRADMPSPLGMPISGAPWSAWPSEVPKDIFQDNVRTGVYDGLKEFFATVGALAAFGGYGGGKSGGVGHWSGNLGPTNIGWGSGDQSPSARAADIMAIARSLGIDPKVALRVAQSEGFYKYTGDIGNGPAYGDFQLNVGRGRMGDAFKRATHLDPSNPANAHAMRVYALQQARLHGWGAWYGAKHVGITGMMGINRSYTPQGTGASAQGRLDVHIVTDGHSDVHSIKGKGHGMHVTANHRGRRMTEIH